MAYHQIVPSVGGTRTQADDGPNKIGNPRVPRDLQETPHLPWGIFFNLRKFLV